MLPVAKVKMWRRRASIDALVRHFSLYQFSHELFLLLSSDVIVCTKQQKRMHQMSVFIISCFKPLLVCKCFRLRKQNFPLSVDIVKAPSKLLNLFVLVDPSISCSNPETSLD